MFDLQLLKKKYLKNLELSRKFCETITLIKKWIPKEGIPLKKEIVKYYEPMIDP